MLLKTSNVKAWYLKTYPNDARGNKINPTVTFSGCRGNIEKAIGITDSIVIKRIGKAVDFLY